MDAEADFEYIKYEPNAEPEANAKYRKEVHPHGTIPALVIPGEPPLLESGAICMYLADKYGKLVPPNKDRRDYYDFIMYAKATLDELMDFYYFLWVVKRDYTQEKIDSTRKKFDECMTYLATRLEGRTYLCGDIFTNADCVLGYDIFLAKILNNGVLLESHPKVNEYYERLSSRDAFKYAASFE